MNKMKKKNIHDNQHEYIRIDGASTAAGCPKAEQLYRAVWSSESLDRNCICKPFVNGILSSFGWRTFSIKDN